MNNTAFAAAIAAFSASAGLLCAAPAGADAAGAQPADQHVLGDAAQVGDSTWTVSNLKPSNDVIAYHPTGTLWEATASDEASHGSATPIVSNFNARAHSGQTYRELFQVASVQGVNPAGITQGQKVSGKLYFDVTGDNPDSVTYNAGGGDLALWVQPPPSVSATGRGAHTTTPAGSPATGPTTANPAAALPAANLGGGSAGTVIPGSAPGPQSPASSNPASAGTPTPGAPAPAAAQSTPAPGAAAGSQGTVGGPDAPAGGLPGGIPAPAAGTPGPGLVPAPASQGTLLQPEPDHAGTAPGPQPTPAPAANTQPSPSPAPAPAG